MAVILGLNCYKHDSAAALLIDGKLIGAVEEERFRRIKHYADYPEKAIDFLLEQADLKPGAIDHVAYYMIPGLVFRENLCYSRNYFFKPGGGLFLAGQLNAARKMRAIPRKMREHLGSDLNPEFCFIEHHIAHAAGAYYCSGFRTAAVLTMDGVGERDTGILGICTPEGIGVISRSRFPNSPGMFYSAVTRHLGFKPDNDEYKVMGLSSYGEPEFLDIFCRMIHNTDDGRILLDSNLLDIQRGVHFAQFSQEVLERIGPERKEDESLEKIHQNIACSAQRALEKTGLTLARFLRQCSREDRLVISGGAGLNCVMNGLIEREAGFSEIFPMPASHDAGTSLGAAVVVHMRRFPGIPLVPPGNMYLGPSSSEVEIKKTLSEARLTYRKPDNLSSAVAELIEQGRVVALYQGKMEFGPRALGNRSILADPRRAEMKGIVNDVVKHREGFRPFAPSCLEEYAGRYFEGCSQARYMIKTYNVFPEKRNKIPAVTHVDGTARVHTVSRKINPLYWEIIDAFRNLTGIPVLLNTSFNVRGEPVVCSPTDAVRCFYSTGIDVLAMPPFLLEK